MCEFKQRHVCVGVNYHWNLFSHFLQQCEKSWRSHWKAPSNAICHENGFQSHWPQIMALCSKILTISASNNSKDVKCLVVGLKGLLPWRSIMLTSKKGEGREKKMPTTCKDTTSQGNWGTNCRLKTVCELHSHQGTKTTRVFDYHFNQEKRSSRSLTSNDNRRRSREKLCLTHGLYFFFFCNSFFFYFPIVATILSQTISISSWLSYLLSNLVTDPQALCQT